MCNINWYLSEILYFVGSARPHACYIHLYRVGIKLAVLFSSYFVWWMLLKAVSLACPPPFYHTSPMAPLSLFTLVQSPLSLKPISIESISIFHSVQSRKKLQNFACSCSRCRSQRRSRRVVAVCLFRLRKSLWKCSFYILYNKYLCFTDRKGVCVCILLCVCVC